MKPNRLRMVLIGVGVFFSFQTFSYFTAQLAHAKDFDPEAAIERVQKECVDRDWSLVRCDYEVGGLDSMYRTNLVLEFGKIAATPLRWLANLLEPLVMRGTYKKEKRIRKRLIEMLKTTRDEQSLSACQTACLATCATAHYGKHTFDATTEDRRDNKAIGYGLLVSGFGMCTQFAMTSKDLAKGIGVKAKTKAGGTFAHGDPHEFLKVKLGKNWWLMEPQSDRCMFMRKKPPKL